MALATSKTYRDYAVDFRFWASRTFNRAWVRPDWVSVNLTLRCNLTCEMCRVCYDVPNELSFAEIQSIMDQVHAWGVPIFNPLGGEPFHRKDILEILEYAADKSFQTTVTNNGTMIGPKRAAALARLQRVHLNFSLDGLEDANDRIRGKGVFRKVWNTIATIRDEEAKLGDYRKWISINCIVSDASFRDLITIGEMARRAGCNMIQFLNLFGYESKEGRPTTDPLWIQPGNLADFDREMDRVAEWVRRLPGTGFHCANAPGDLLLLKDYYRHRVEPHRAKCYNGFKEMYINSDGETLICDAHLNFTKESYGNVRQRSLRELWEGAKARELRKNVVDCTSPCIQDCYLRRDSDAITPILAGLAKTRFLESPIGRLIFEGRLPGALPEPSPT